MSRQIPAKASLCISEQETAQRDTQQGKVLFTSCKGRDCALLIQRNRLTAVSVLSETVSKIGAIYIGRVKNIAKNIDACFVETAEGEVCFLPLKKAASPFLLNRAYDGRLVQGDTLLVQVERDAQKSKQASVTAQISLSNDYFVLAMGSPHMSYTSRLDREQRETLQKRISFLFTEHAMTQMGELIQDWNSLLSGASVRRLEAGSISVEGLPLPSTGCIVRTKAAEEGVAVTTLLESFFALTEQYARLLHTARYRSCFTCLREAPGAVEAVLQNLASEQEYQEIVTDDEELYRRLAVYCSSREDSVPLRLYQDSLLPLSKLYSLDSRLETALERRVWLKSGGYLIIEPTEAMTVIDVNSGKYEAAGRGGREAALTVNLEAAREVARQLRLRNLSGIIIVDFINMAGEDSKAQVMSLLRQLTEGDRVKTTVVDMTPLGLVEITRKKTSRPLWEQFR